MFVGTYTLAQNPNGAYEGVGVLSKGVPTLMPVTDAVMFFDGDMPEDQEMIGRTSWARFVEVMGDAMLDTRMFPTRFYVSAFPTAPQQRSLFDA